LGLEPRGCRFAGSGKTLSATFLDRQWKYSRKAAIFDWEQTLDATDSVTTDPRRDNATPPSIGGWPTGLNGLIVGKRDSGPRNELRTGNKAEDQVNNIPMVRFKAGAHKADVMAPYARQQ
jgi:hypothetical protein